MKNKFKLSALMLALTLTSGFSYAQEKTAVISAPEKVREGNSFEREMTPLLREISKRKSQLELRKIERELAKIDEDEIKVQLEIEEKNKKNSQINSLGGAGLGGADSTMGMTGMIPGQMGGVMNVPGQINLPMPGVAPSGMPGAAPGFPQQQASSPVATEPPPAPKKEDSTPVEDLPPLVEIKVLMIYGFDGNLSAKIAAGAQGGYVVQKGDIMPDGRVVTAITNNFIEVKEVKNKLSKNTSRIFVSSGEQQGPSDNGKDNGPGNGPAGGQQDSSNGGNLNLGGKSTGTNGAPPPVKSITEDPLFNKLSPQDQATFKANESFMNSMGSVGIKQTNK